MSKKKTGPSKELVELKEVLLKQFDGDKKKANYWIFIPNRIVGNHTPVELINNRDTKYVLTAVKEAIKAGKFE